MKPYDLTVHDGRTVDWLTKSALLVAEERLGYPLTILQGSYSRGVSQSAGTHDGGGVVDLAGYDAERKVRVLRQIGFAAWHRTPRQGDWGEHVHAVLIGNDKLSPAARAQVRAYIANTGNGLAGSLSDDGPRLWVDRRWKWPYPSRVQRARQILRAWRLTGKAAQ